ncbi:LytR/AlgR family response regulator transcription factor [Maribacter antarcticus]|uniref:LytR/AlgR family response regulator transcription factor n=1 Tax=Maribacter antarcticus TaxID=505250 RepID=UPI00047EF1FD
MINSSVKIVIPDGNKKYLFDKNEIKFIKSDRYYVNIFCLNRKVLIRITMKRLEQLLPSDFLRINKSIIVNSSFIVRIEETKSSCCIVISDEIEQQVTEKYKPIFDDYFSLI